MILTNKPIEVKLILSSWLWSPKLPATSTTICRQVQGIVGRKSVTTNWRHWNAVRIKDSLEKKKKGKEIYTHVFNRNGRKNTYLTIKEANFYFKVEIRKPSLTQTRSYSTTNIYINVKRDMTCLKIINR